MTEPGPKAIRRRNLLPARQAERFPRDKLTCRL